MAIILASSSPQRKKILETMGLTFSVIPAHVDEHHAGYVRPHLVSMAIAKRKAEAIAKKHPGDWVIGCDTIVLLRDGSISVKPKHREDARRILKMYQGSHCDVYSGLALVHRNSKKTYLDFERTRIFFNAFSDQSLEAFLDTGEWKGRSGAMTIEGKGHWTKKIEGEYWNIVGLPVDLLKKQLKQLMLL